MATTDEGHKPEPEPVVPTAEESNPETVVAFTTTLVPEPVPDPEPKSESVPVINLLKIDLGLRVVLFATTLAAVVVMVLSKDVMLVNFPLAPAPLAFPAKFNYSPALIYLVAANSVACSYSVISAIMSALTLTKPYPKTMHLFILALFDALMVGVVASATGAGASVAYVGLKGNSHVGWFKICNMYGKFCRYTGSSITVSLVASVVLVLLVLVSTFSLYRRSQ